MKKERADILVQRHANVSQSKAQGLIQTGHVALADGTPVRTAGMQLDENATLNIKDLPRYVSRGGIKLEGALEDLQVDVSGRTAIDVGASTGGFTDCLLQHGARKVYAVDVGYSLLAWRLRDDDRVVPLERTNIRNLTPEELPEKPDFFTADCSFISLALVLPPLSALLTENAEGLILIKPQFEAGKDEVDEGGVVRDEAVRRSAIDRALAAAEAAGFSVIAEAPCRLKGPAGNREHFAHLKMSQHA